MNSLTDIFTNRILITSGVAWFAAQLIKLIITFVRDGVVDWRLMFSPGGMPSGHSATVISLTVAIGLNQGWASPIFALSASFAMVVMYDAAGIRRAAGKQAATLNRIIDRLTSGKPHERKQFSPDELREILGHTPFQVAIGACLGVIVALLLN